MRLYQKPSGIWVVDFVDPNGTRRRVSTGTRDKSLARAQGRALATGKAEPIGAPLVPTRLSTEASTMDALWRRCENTIWHPREIKSLATLASNLRILRSVEIMTEKGHRRFADLDPAEVRFSHLDALAQALFARGYASGTVKRKMDMVGRSLTEAARWEIIPARPPMPTIAPGGVRERVITEAEEKAIFKVVADREVAEPNRPWKRYGYLLRFLMDTACRLGEALALRREWIETSPNGQVLVIPGSVTKNGKGRTIPLTSAVVEMLPFLEAGAVKGRLFPMSPGTAQYYWRENVVPDLLEQGFDLTDAVLHTFRHTKLTRLAKLPGFGIHRVSQWAGHSDIKVTAKVYAKLDVTDLWAGVT